MYFSPPYVPEYYGPSFGSGYPTAASNPIPRVGLLHLSMLVLQRWRSWVMMLALRIRLPLGAILLLS